MIDYSMIEAIIFMRNGAFDNSFEKVTTGIALSIM
jgi:hypothetical protein